MLGFPGGVRVANGDTDGDGAAEVITAPGAGGGPHVRIFAGSTAGTPLTEFFAYVPSFTGGVYVAAGDVDGDGKAEIITGADAGGGPHVRILKVVRVTLFGVTAFVVIIDFFAYDPSFLGGVRVAAGDVDGDGRAEVITAPGPGGGPHLRVWKVEEAFGGLRELGGFFAYAPSFVGGVYVAARDMTE